jgi:hypothetical protein
MRTAICISGQFRTWDKIKDNILKNIINDNADVFYVCDQEISIPNINYQIIQDPQIIYDKSDIELFRSKKRPETSVENCLNMFYKIMKCNELKIHHENEHNFKYDIVVRLRTDTPFNSPLSFSMDKNMIVIPHNLDYGGVCDQFAYGPSNLMDIFCQTFPNIKHYIDEGCIFHPETILKYHCDKNHLNISRQDVGILSIIR